MIEFPGGRHTVQVSVVEGRVRVAAVDKYGDSIQVSLTPQIAADLGQAIQRAATEASHGSAHGAAA
jgi:hypothetical protein